MYVPAVLYVVVCLACCALDIGFLLEIYKYTHLQVVIRLRYTNFIVYYCDF